MRVRVPFSAPWWSFWRQWLVAPVSGEYTVEAEIDGVRRSVSTRVDAAIMLPRPASVGLDMMTRHEVRASWPAVSGAVSYLVILAEHSPWLTVHSWHTTSTSVTFPAVSLRTDVDYVVEVSPFNFDSTRGWQVTVPSQANTSARWSATFRVTAAGTLQIKDVRDVDDRPPYDYFTRGR
jgi:hypothetical protein